MCGSHGAITQLPGDVPSEMKMPEHVKSKHENEQETKKAKKVLGTKHWSTTPTMCLVSGFSDKANPSKFASTFGENGENDICECRQSKFPHRGENEIT